MDYHLFTFIILCVLLILSNINQSMSPYINISYMIADSIYTSMFPYSVEKSNMFIHQQTIYYICICAIWYFTILQNIQLYKYIYKYYINIEVSSLCIMSRRWHRQRSLSRCIWVLFRFVYLPYLICKFNPVHVKSLSTIGAYTCNVCMWVLYLMGVIWSLEPICIRLNPVILMSISSFIPIMSFGTAPLMITSTLNHIFGRQGNIYYIIYTINVYAYMVWCVSQFWNFYSFWTSFIIIIYISKYNKGVWDDTCNIIPRMAMYYINGMCVYYCTINTPRLF